MPKVSKKKSVKKSMPKNDIVKKINKLEKLAKAGFEDIYVQNYYGINSLTQDFFYFNLTDYAGTVDVFGTAADDVTSNKMTLKEIKIDFRIDANTEKDLIGYTVYLVSLKDEASDRLNPSTGVLSLTTAIDYAQYLGGAFVNPKLFTVHRRKYFNTTNMAIATTIPSANNSKIAYDFSWTIKPNKVIVNPRGNWSALHSSLDPSKCYYLLVFNNNSSADSENPTIQLNEIMKLRVTN